MYVRNTENPLHDPLGRYHPFEGDGMLHRIDFKDGRATYGNRWVRTRCFRAEQEVGHGLWGSLMDGPGVSQRPGFGAHGGLKDASSTDVVVHAGKILSTFYQCGEAYRIDPVTLETEGVAGWGPLDGVSAHCKVDEATGELLFFNYSVHEPYMHYGVVDRDNRLVHYIPVPLPGPRLPHDMAFTKNYSILNDCPLFWDPELLKRGLHAVRFHRDMPTRFAILPRHGRPEEIRWFEAEPTYVLHFMNAYEDGDEVVMDGYFQEDPEPGPLAGVPPKYAQMMAYLDEQSYRPKLHRWRFNLRTGRTTEQRLDGRNLEFGMFNAQYAGLPYRYVYSTATVPGWFLFNSYVKHDLETGESWQITLPEGRYASESPFAPRVGARDEDDGYLVSFIMDQKAGRGECILIDCKRFMDGPVCRIALPHKPCSGTHSVWAPRRLLTG
jgi:carotenoid cleavage dioxygenase